MSCSGVCSPLYSRGAHHHPSTFLCGKLDLPKPLLPPAHSWKRQSLVYHNSGSNFDPCTLNTVPGFHRSRAGKGGPGVERENRTDIIRVGLNIYGEEQCSDRSSLSTKGPRCAFQLAKKELLCFGDFPFTDLRHSPIVWTVLVGS